MLQTILTPRPGANLSGRVRWMDIMDGVRVCDFDCMLSTRAEPAPLPDRHFEALFCRGGGLCLEMKNGFRSRVQKGNILLLSDTSCIHGALIPEGCLAGDLVAVDAPAARQSLSRLCMLLGGLHFDTAQAGKLMQSHHGCAVIRNAAWVDAVFAALRPLSAEDRARYSVLKAAELLYLLRSGSPLLPSAPAAPYRDRYQLALAQQVQEYMLTHLAEPLTIPYLANRFHVSPTGLKDCFRQLYGRPLHQYLLECRIQKAAELLREGSLSVMEVAAAVGYTSASQFGVAFKRRFRLTPSQFRRLAREERRQHPLPLSRAE